MDDRLAPHPDGRPQVMGVVNVTPDSFSDGGRFLDPTAARDHALALLDAGADWLDVGGESTRPYADPVDAGEECARVLPVITALARACADIPDGPVVSVDTYKAETARRALDAGAMIVNDVSACRFDPGLLDVVAEAKPGYVLMHSLGRPGDMQDAPAYNDTVAEIMAFFEERLDVLVRAGLPEDHIVLDPGVGFGKLLDHNLEILQNIAEFGRLGRPVYLGLSHKSLFGALLDLGPGRRGTATQVATALAAERGASIHRVHDVAETRRTLDLVRALRAA